MPTPNLSSTMSTHQKAIVLPLPRPGAPSPKSTEGNKPNATVVGRLCTLPLPRTESEILSCPYLKAFPFNELRMATGNFNEDESLLGEGGFGCVFKGWLDEDFLSASTFGSGAPVAIKKLIPWGFQGHNEWLVCYVLFLRTGLTEDISLYLTTKIIKTVT